MALVEFVNNTEPYLNAENLNNNFGELETNINAIQDYTDNLGNVYKKTLNVLSSELEPSDWRTCCTADTVDLPAGTYLFIAAGRFTAVGGSGFVTFRPVIGGTADNGARSSIIINSFTTDGVILTTREFASDTSVALNLQGYANIKFKCIADTFTIIKLK